MPAPISIQKVDIAGYKYFSIIDGEKTEITEEQFNAGPSGDAVYSRNIAFDTPSGELSDGQYATQENGFHWVKIPGYKVIKIHPDMVAKGKTTVAGLNKILADSEAE